MPITAKEFLRAFSSSWNETLQEKGSRLKSVYTDPKKWTRLMLNGKNGILHSTMNELTYDKKLFYQTEWYTIDALYVSGKKYDPDDKEYWLNADLEVLIEHENWGDEREEMWKLMHWKAPLKVLVFYDYLHKYRGRKGKGDIDSRIQALWKMVDESTRFFKENEETEYLFIIGTREGTSDPDDHINWKWATNKSRRPKPLTSRRLLKI